jgi:hypothetical protein
MAPQNVKESLYSTHANGIQQFYFKSFIKLKPHKAECIYLKFVCNNLYCKLPRPSP